MLVPSGIMFLMYRFSRIVALVYIRRTLAGGGSGRTETDQGFYSLMVAPPEVPRNAEGRKVKAALVEDGPVPQYDAANRTSIIKAGAP